MKWEKGLAATDRVVFDLATRPALLEYLRLLLGDNVVLWGASLLMREPNQVHPWHSDIESSAPDGGFVSVWIGIENTSRESAFQFITGSHLIGKTIQQVANERGLRRGEASAATVLSWASALCLSAEVVQPDMNDGEALFFDGRLWHGSENTRATGTRTALLFQYAAASKRVKMPDFRQLEWPFRFQRSRIPTVVISGTDSSHVNHTVPPPCPAPERILETQFCALKLPLLEDPAGVWRTHDLFAGSTRNVSVMRSHVSVLSPGHSPHPPHAHGEEEILIVVDGDVELVIADSTHEDKARRERLTRGEFVYYPAFQFHTICNATDRPVTYLMFKWTAPPRETEAPLRTTIVRAWQAARHISDPPFATQCILEGPSHYLAKVHAHVTQIQPGAGYAAHTDAHDVALVLLSGTLEPMGHRIESPAVVYFPAGKTHDMKNLGTVTAHYLVFEFHGPVKGEDGPCVSADGARFRWYRLRTNIRSRLRQHFGSTMLWHGLRRVYKRLR